MEHEIAAEVLGGEFEKAEKAELASKVRDAEEAAKDEVWAAYRFVVLADQKAAGGQNVIDLGAGHASAAETLTGRVITALKSQGLLNESVGAGYIERNWPPALKDSGAWPLAGLRQSFLNGALTRLLDPDSVLRGKIPEFVAKGEFGLASGPTPDGGFSRVWWNDLVLPDEVTFEAGVFLLTKARAKSLKAPTESAEVGGSPAAGKGGAGTAVETIPVDVGVSTGGAGQGAGGAVAPAQRTLRITGTIPPEVWNRLGTRIIPKLKAGSHLQLGLTFTVTVDAAAADSFERDLRQALGDLGLPNQLDLRFE